MKNIIKFSRNWNRKLAGEYYTTIRSHDIERYAVGSYHQIHYADKGYLHTAQVVDHKTISLHAINDWIAYLDTGHNSESAQKLISKLYPGQTKLSYVLLHQVPKSSIVS